MSDTDHACEEALSERRYDDMCDECYLRLVGDAE